MASPKTIARLESQIHRRAAHCLQHEMADPRLTFVTITKVELSTDIAVVKVFYSVLGDRAEHTKTQHLLEHARGFVQRKVASILRTRSAPVLRWVFDSSIEEAARMHDVIRAARERDREINPNVDSVSPEPDTDPTGDPEDSSAD